MHGPSRLAVEPAPIDPLRSASPGNARRTSEVIVERIGFLGLGTMGAAMAANLARAGFGVIAWNRSPGRAPELDDLGVERAASPADVARAANTVVICVSDTPDVEAVLFGTGGLVVGAGAR